MKRTKITYKCISGNLVKIKTIENVATMDELSNEFGKISTSEYLTTFPRYLTRTSLGASKIWVRSDKNLSFNLFPDQILPKEEFGKCISIMKASGERLKKLIEFNKVTALKIEKPSEKKKEYLFLYI